MGKSPPQAETVHTSVYLPRAMHIALRKRLIDEGMSLTEWVRKQAEELLET